MSPGGSLGPAIESDGAGRIAVQRRYQTDKLIRLNKRICFICFICYQTDTLIRFEGDRATFKSVRRRAPGGPGPASPPRAVPPWPQSLPPAGRPKDSDRPKGDLSRVRSGGGIRNPARFPPLLRVASQAGPSGFSLASVPCQMSACLATLPHERESPPV